MVIEKDKERPLYLGTEITRQLQYSEIILSNSSVFNLILNFEFYYYECESVNDRGWGSGWRCFQSFLKTALNYIKKLNFNNKSVKALQKVSDESPNQINLQTDLIYESTDESDKYSKIKNFDFSFENLFLNYGDREKLDQIYIKKRLSQLNQKLNELETSIKNEENEEANSSNEDINTQIGDLLTEKDLLDRKILSDFIREKAYAPFESLYGWAEPFILDLISFDFNLKTKLYLLNGQLEEAYTPKQLFEKPLSFPEFIELAIDNFSKKRPLPIIIDDSTVSLCVLGVKKIVDEVKNEGFYRLLIADPHVAKDKEAESGIYTVDVSESGKFLIENNKLAKMNGKRLRFDVMEFMVIVAEDIEEN